MDYVILSLGSNVGNREEYLRKAIHELKNFFEIHKVSSIYETSPIGYTDQEKFLNMVVAGTTKLDIVDFFSNLKRVERDIGRKPTFRWGPREIDIDIVYFGNREIKNELLEIPHKERLNRAFVVVPLVEIFPDFFDFKEKILLKEIARKLKKDQKIKILKNLFENR